MCACINAANARLPSPSSTFETKTMYEFVINRVVPRSTTRTNQPCRIKNNDVHSFRAVTIDTYHRIEFRKKKRNFVFENAIFVIYFIIYKRVAFFVHTTFSRFITRQRRFHTYVQCKMLIDRSVLFNREQKPNSPSTRKYLDPDHSSCSCFFTVRAQYRVARRSREKPLHTPSAASMTLRVRKY